MDVLKNAAVTSPTSDVSSPRFMDYTNFYLLQVIYYIFRYRCIMNRLCGGDAQVGCIIKKTIPKKSKELSKATSRWFIWGQRYTRVTPPTDKGDVGIRASMMGVTRHSLWILLTEEEYKSAAFCKLDLLNRVFLSYPYLPMIYSSCVLSQRVLMD